MTLSEQNQAIHYETGPIRPPSEAMSLILRVTRNCPWNRCRFCTSYKNQNFEVRPASEVMDDIDAIARIAATLLRISESNGDPGKMTRSVLEHAAQIGIPSSLAYQVALFLSGGGHNVFLQDANSLVMEKDELIKILEHLKCAFPTIRRVTTYARSLTLAKLGEDSLSAIAQAGLTRVHVGLESGSDNVLRFIRKGTLSKHHIAGGRAAKSAGLELSEYVMPGIGGKALSEEHAHETARTLNEIDPDFIRLRSFFPLPGSEMSAELAEGRFEMPNEDEIVAEIRLLISRLDGLSGMLVSDHDRNLLMEVEGRLPDDKPHMLAVLDRYLALDENARQVFRIGRRLGYFQLLDDIQDAQAYAQAETATHELERRFGNADLGLLKTLPIHM